MTVFPLLAASFIMTAVTTLFLICAVALILIVLIQKGRGGGLGGAFGAALPSGILGSKTGDFLTWVTIVLASLFLSLAVVMAKYYKPSISDFDTGQAQQPLVEQEQEQELSPEQGLEPAEVGDTDTDANLPGG